MSEKVNVDRLRKLAPKGMKTAKYARAVGIHQSNLPNALRRHGLYRTWQQARFKKCASPTVGITSVTTASAETASPSAR
jgi:hypothetical protein